MESKCPCSEPLKPVSLKLDFGYDCQSDGALEMNPSSDKSFGLEKIPCFEVIRTSRILNRDLNRDGVVLYQGGKG